MWEKKRERRYNLEDIDLEKGSDDMEKEIMATMRKRTMSKASTWERQNQMGNANGHVHGHGISEKVHVIGERLGKKME